MVPTNKWAVNSDMTSSAAETAICCLKLDDLCSILAKQKAFVELQLSWTLNSPVTNLPFSANCTVHHAGPIGLHHNRSAMEPIGYYGSMLVIKGKTQETAVRSVERYKAHLPACIIQNPPAVNLQPCFFSSFPFFSLHFHRFYFFI